MKKIIFTLSLCLLPLIAFGKVSCPSGLTNCNTPCATYIDMDDDGNCDYIQSNLQAKNTSEKAENITQKKNQNIKPAIIPQKPIKTVKKATIKKTYKRKHYRLLPISLSLFFLYILTIILYKKKIIEPRTHFKFWNFTLLITFLISALLGILLVIMINYGIRLKLPFNIILWHTEAGIAMFMISLFHIHWHWQYIKNIFRIKGYDASRIKKLYPSNSQK